MNIDIGNALWLLLCFAVPIILWYIAKKGNFQNTFFRRFFILIRSIVALFLILALCNITIQKTSQRVTTIFAIDLSDSAKQSQQNIKTFLKQAESTVTEKDDVGILCFGADAVLEQSPVHNVPFSQNFLSYVKKNGTNISNVLNLAYSVIPEKTRKRVVLLSDGIETAGDALAQSKLLQSQGIAVDVYCLEPEEQPEVQLSGCKIASVINKNTEYDVTLQISSNIDTNANIKLFKGNTLIANEQIAVAKGESNIVFSDKTENGGSILYRAELTAEQDTLSQNNKAYGYCYVTDVVQILLIEQQQSDNVWEDFLQNSQVAVTKTSIENAPVTVEQFNHYDGVILADVPEEQMPKGFLDALESYVKTTGGGLFVTGGEHSFALGGYYKTKLEEILPVEMELKTEGENNSLGMIMVIDRSGSMDGGNYGVSKMEMAKEAAIRSLNSFMPGDCVGVIAFDDIAEWAVPFQSVQDNIEDIRMGIGSIQPGGGTSILPSLNEAYNMLKDANTKQKHIILLTDGQAEQTGYDGIIEKMNASGITLSTVAVGTGADTLLLQRLANQGSGRYYFTNEFSDLPEIFAKETLLAGKEYINNRTFYPKQKNASAIMADIDSMASLGGYIGTTAKPRADVVLESDKQEPILATWQYGLGRTAVWTSDVSAKWTKDWLASQQGRQILQNSVSWVMKKQSDKNVSVNAEIEGEKTILTVSMAYDENVEMVKGTVISNHNKTYDVVLNRTSPNVYTGIMDGIAEGGYILNLQITNQQGQRDTVNTGFAIAYPKEYDRRNWGKGSVLLNRIAEITGGRILTDGADVFTEKPQSVTESKNLTNLFLVLAFITFLIDVFFRRFYVATQYIENLMNRFKKYKKQTVPNEITQNKRFEKEMKQAQKRQQKQYKQSKEKTEQKEQQKENDMAVKLAEAKKKRKR